MSVQPITAPWQLEGDLKVSATDEGRVKIVVGGVQMPEYTAIGATLDDAVGGLIQSITEDAIADEALAWSEENPALALVLAERRHQVALGYDDEHDDLHRNGSLARAAMCYASIASIQSEKGIAIVPDCFRHKAWPWEPQDFSAEPSPLKNAVKAAALLLAEIARLQRLEAKEGAPS